MICYSVSSYISEERQKVVRRIKQVKRDLTSAQGKGKERDKLEGELEGLRVDLNYILVRVSNLMERVFSNDDATALPEDQKIYITLSSRKTTN